MGRAAGFAEGLFRLYVLRVRGHSRALDLILLGMIGAFREPTNPTLPRMATFYRHLDKARRNLLIGGKGSI